MQRHRVETQQTCLHGIPPTSGLPSGAAGSKALRLSARGVTTVPGSNLGDITSGLPCGAAGSKALRLSARGVTTVPGSNLGCIMSDCDWESHKAEHNWSSVVRVWPWGRPSL